MRLNHPLRIRKWWPVAAAMPRMLKVLSQHPELGCLGFQQWFGRTTILVQYWRDFDSLDRFAKDSGLPLVAWRHRLKGKVGRWENRAGSSIGTSRKARCGWAGRPAGRSRRG